MHVPHRRRALAVLLLALAAHGCGNDKDPTPISATAPTPTPPPAPQADVIEFRVTGNVSSVAITTDDPYNGTSVVVTGLPYDVTLNSTRSTAFVSLDAVTLTSTTTSGTYYGNFLVAQIFVNGVLFLQASDQSSSPHAQVSGTWRR